MTGSEARAAKTKPARKAGARLGRPLKSQSGEIDALILETARGHFLTKGFAATSMDAIAAEAGVGKATLYSRFASKHDLFEAIAKDRLQAWSKLEPGPDRATVKTIDELLLIRAKSVLDSISRPEVRAFERLLSAESQRFPELAREFYDRGVKGLRASVEEELLAAMPVKRRGVRQDLSYASTIFAAALIGWYRVESTVREVGQEERYAYAEQVVSLFLKGVGL